MTDSDTTNQRKLEHLRIVRNDRYVDRDKQYFDQVRVIHRALPELDFEAVDPSVEFMGKRLSFPFLASSMTGGDREMVRRVNRNLAIAAQRTGVAMGVGSQRVLFSHPRARASFALRDYAPDTILLANLGAVQLKHGFGVEQCEEAVAVLGADALCLHVNPLQERIQPEGNTDFAGLGACIGAVGRELSVPVVVKEVGAGISRPDAELLVEHGIRYVDVAGAGGTSWSRIEQQREPIRSATLGVCFQDWGMPTPVALQQLAPLRERLTLIASGGIRTGIDMAKAMILGASLCGMALPLLDPALESPEAVCSVIERLREEFVTAMFLLGAASPAVLLGNAALLLPPWDPAPSMDTQKRQ